MNLKYYSVLFSILGISFLYILTSFCRPVYVDLSEISNYEGKQVVTKGRIIEISETQYGNQIITIEYNNSTAKVFSEEKINIEYGDIIETKGKIEKYNDIFEIVVENKENIHILERWDNITLPIWQLSLEPNRYLGTNVKVKGYIDDIYNSFFHLKDLDTEHTILVSHSTKNAFYLQSGKEVIVKGLFTYEEQNLRYIIKLYDDKHGVSLRG